MDRLRDVLHMYIILETVKGSRSPIPVLLVIAGRNQCSKGVCQHTMSISYKIWIKSLVLIHHNHRTHPLY